MAAWLSRFLGYETCRASSTRDKIKGPLMQHCGLVKYRHHRDAGAITNMWSGCVYSLCLGLLPVNYDLARQDDSLPARPCSCIFLQLLLNHALARTPEKCPP